MSSAGPGSFVRFPRLPAEIRLLIWSFYFCSPRIHVLHSVDDANPDTDRVQLTCTTLDAQTNIPVSPRIYTEICWEARQVALQSLKSRERMWTLTEPIKYKYLFSGRMPRRLRGAGQPPGRFAVDVDWDRDLIYLCSPASPYPFMALALRDWAPKVRRMAIALPWTTRSLPGQHPHGGDLIDFGRKLLSDAVRKLEGLGEIFVVLLPPLEVTDSSDATSAASESSEVSRITKSADRSAFGFIKPIDYIRHVGKGAIWVASVDMTRASLALDSHLEQLGRQSRVTLRRMVDVDFCRLQDGEYQRYQRDIP